MTAWVVGGPAGSGKTTLGRALADRVGAVLLDLDTLTNPLLDALTDRIAPDSHWNDPRLRPTVRPARYAVLLAAAADQVTEHLVLVAPFTAELRGGPEWTALREAIAPRTPRVVWLDATADLLAARRDDRGAERDRFAAVSLYRPRVPHQRIDADASTEAQLAALLSA